MRQILCITEIFGFSPAIGSPGMPCMECLLGSWGACGPSLNVGGRAPTGNRTRAVGTPVWRKSAVAQALWLRIPAVGTPNVITVQQTFDASNAIYGETGVFVFPLFRINYQELYVLSCDWVNCSIIGTFLFHVLPLLSPGLWINLIYPTTLVKASW